MRVKRFYDFIKESVDTDASDQMQSYYEAIKKLKRTSIITPFDYQNFDKEFFFEFSHNGVEYRVHYSNQVKKIMITNMDTGSDDDVTSMSEFMKLIS